MKLSDIFKGINLGNTGIKFNPFLSPNLTGFSAATRTLPNEGGTYSSPVVTPPNTNIAPPVAQQPAPIFSAPSQAQVSAPPVSTPQARSKYINPQTGDFFQSAEEYGAYVGGRLPTISGDIGKYSGDALTNPNAANLESQARTLSSARNDIATGTTDPYDITQGGDIVFSPEDRTAIEKAYAGVYDPALDDVFARLKKREEERAAALELQNKLAMMEKQQQYDLQLKQTPTYSDLNPANTGDYNLNSKQQAQLLNITNKYSADATVNQGLSAIQIKNITKAINENPESSGNQLMALYTLVKNLDPDTAVREGELTLASKTNSYLGKFQDSLNRIATGRVLNPTAIKELTTATDLLANEWVSASQRRQKQYSSQANVFGLSQPFEDYVGGFQNPDTIAGNTELPSTMTLNGQTLYLQADGTYE